ncbi:uncharacterized protein L969DRAFT_80335 [Mixia osmundae IAM 14324]|uniref:Aromatic-L-amino-acid decarboxylase n=1 Tax=Mixia osmundae (strain CBS 9802 / IAM 14324 / JCM 22182 / KY 12970) TaxID=764103 RepID=G7DUJ7_MIXOS|nr:uncharacterized protein L969DRAFT_80335 [Mixia osmundae IAM 14324]KEI36408.1 hypothetical protein L969DRAFT_80335 [Mixia osmundae IAM 14324]GAA94257.1 hypothetical protein E5Q_00906 [Mixia osmundae IAM 14324]
MNADEFREVGHAAIEQIASYFETLSERDVESSVKPGDCAASFAREPPAKGQPSSDLLKDFNHLVLPGISHWQHPSFFAYFPANTTFESILADLLVGAVSNPGFNWSCSPVCTELETLMMRWTALLFGLDLSFTNEQAPGGGIIMGSASESTVTICIAARERALQIVDASYVRGQVSAFSSRLSIWVTDQTHSLGAKAGLILGLPVRTLPTRAQDGYALTESTLALALADAKAKDEVPCILIATLGSTSSGAIDDLEGILGAARACPTLYIHIDAAWAGVVLACPEHRDEAGLSAINCRSGLTVQAANKARSFAYGEVTSFSTNMHKWGLVTFDANCLWTRDRTQLTDALDITPPFLRNQFSDSVIDYRNMQISLGRRFRSLKIYFVLKSYGVEGFQRHIRAGIALAERLEKLLVEDADFELVTSRRWSLVVFRLKARAQESAEETNALNAELVERLSQDRSIMLTQTVLSGRTCIRFAIGSPQTQAEHIDEAYTTIRRAADAAVASKRISDLVV